MKLRIRVPGSCGELVQGFLQDEYFLVTCPIDRYSEAVIEAAVEYGADLPLKAGLAVEMSLKRLGVSEKRFKLELVSQLPQGKGMASSSADIAAVCQAVACFHGKPFSTRELAEISLAIEPTDGVFLPGVALFGHVDGHIQQSLGQPPPLKIMIFDIGGEVDTVAFNKRQELFLLNKLKSAVVAEALQFVRAGLESADARLIASGATLSSFANQSILLKPELDAIWKFGKSCGALGINVAHSGTVLGLFFAADAAPENLQRVLGVQRLCAVRYLDTVNFIGGGVWIREGEETVWKKCI